VAQKGVRAKADHALYFNRELLKSANAHCP